MAEALPRRLAALVFLDAFTPEDGQSLADILGEETMAGMRASLVDAGGRRPGHGAADAWLLPPGLLRDYGVTEPGDAAWVATQLTYTPIRTFEERASIANPEARGIPRYFIRCAAFQVPALAAQERKARAAGWPTYTLPTGHDVMVTMPDALAGILLEVAEGSRVSKG